MVSTNILNPYCRERQLMTATLFLDDTSNGKTIRGKKIILQHWHGKLSGNVFLRSLHQVPRKKGLVRNKYKDFQQKQTSEKYHRLGKKWPSGGVVLSLNYPGTIRELYGGAYPRATAAPEIGSNKWTKSAPTQVIKLIQSK